MNNRKKIILVLSFFSVSTWAFAQLSLQEIFAKATQTNRIIAAAKAGDLETVKSLLKENSDLAWSKGDFGESPLYNAARFDRKDVAELLLASKADVNTKTDDGVTPLHMAAANGNKDMAELLLANQADVNAKSDAGWTPLDAAAMNYKLNVLELLLAKGADVNARMTNGLTALLYAADWRDQDGVAAIKLLLANKADPNATNIINGLTPLHYATAEGNKDIVELLLVNGANVNAKANDGSTPLSIAAHGDHKDAAAVLLANHAEVNAKANDGTTPLTAAFCGDHKDIVELLLTNKAEADLATLDGKTYRNITEFSKYPKQIFFTCNHERIGVSITNLPEDFVAYLKAPTPNSSRNDGR